jgi:hypothetical protein
MTLWAEAVNATGREMVLENCNNGGYVPYGVVVPGRGRQRPQPGDHDQGCPFNMFRTGIDIAPSPLSTVSNLLDTADFLNVSKPGCVSTHAPVLLRIGPSRWLGGALAAACWHASRAGGGWWVLVCSSGRTQTCSSLARQWSGPTPLATSPAAADSSARSATRAMAPSATRPPGCRSSRAKLSSRAGAR